MSTLAIVGAQWGDEGKGKVVDILSENADYIVRFQGGNNAGHTVVIGGTKYILHLLPSGILHDNKRCVLGNGMVIDLEGFLNELEFMKRVGVDVEGRIFVSERAHIILPYHKELDAAAERLRGNSSIGTTLKGIGPAYRDKAGRVGIRIADLKDEKTFKEKLKWNVREKELTLKYVYNYDVKFDIDKIYSQTMRMYERISNFVSDTVYLINRAIDDGENVLFEGAQATLLDIDIGTYPFVTSSNSSSLGICTGTGISPKKVEKVYGIAKAYTTRVGGGPFPTELKENVGELLRARGHEYGSTTGRARRCGWLDLFALKYSKMVNDLDGLIITKLDVLDAFDEVKVCVGYEFNGELIDYFPSTAKELSEVKPIYETLPGWKCDITSVKNFEDLPKEAQNFLNFVEDYLETKIPLVSTGPQRDEVMTCRKMW